MNRTLHPILIVIVLMFLSVSAAAQQRSIARADLVEKISGFWIGQLVGNYMGFPFENVYVNEPIPILVDRYYRYQKGDYKAPVSVVSSLVNGLCGVMAILYGEGDFMKTVGIAVSAGYDCDNQAATCGGLMGVVLGVQAIPPALTQDCLPRGRWSKPFNDTYINHSRDGLPNYNRISDIVERIANTAETAILQEGGKKLERDGQIVYAIPRR